MNNEFRFIWQYKVIFSHYSMLHYGKFQHIYFKSSRFSSNIIDPNSWSEAF
jgi:hypothetical protein